MLEVFARKPASRFLCWSMSTEALTKQHSSSGRRYCTFFAKTMQQRENTQGKRAISNTDLEKIHFNSAAVSCLVRAMWIDTSTSAKLSGTMRQSQNSSPSFPEIQS